jgi:catechol 2,3-dioxygenase-like lactoylglutathione lyase family enzyme
MAEGLFKGVAQVGVVTREPAQLIAFYRDVLGFPVLFEANGMTFMAAGATSLMIGAGDGELGVAKDVVLYFEPHDWRAAEAKLEAAGVKFEHGEVIVQRAEGREHVLRPFRDPEGRPVYLLGWRAVG